MTDTPPPALTVSGLTIDIRSDAGAFTVVADMALEVARFAHRSDGGPAP